MIKMKGYLGTLKCLEGIKYLQKEYDVVSGRHYPGEVLAVELKVDNSGDLFEGVVICEYVKGIKVSVLKLKINGVFAESEGMILNSKKHCALLREVVSGSLEMISNIRKNPRNKELVELYGQHFVTLTCIGPVNKYYSLSNSIFRKKYKDVMKFKPKFSEDKDFVRKIGTEEWIEKFCKGDFQIDKARELFSKFVKISETEEYNPYIYKYRKIGSEILYDVPSKEQ